jgi:hypothetical protein
MKGKSPIQLNLTLFLIAVGITCSIVWWYFHTNNDMQPHSDLLGKTSLAVSVFCFLHALMFIFQPGAAVVKASDYLYYSLVCLSLIFGVNDVLGRSFHEKIRGDTNRIVGELATLYNECTSLLFKHRFELPVQHFRGCYLPQLREPILFAVPINQVQPQLYEVKIFAKDTSDFDEILSNVYSGLLSSIDEYDSFVNNTFRAPYNKDFLIIRTRTYAILQEIIPLQAELRNISSAADAASTYRRLNMWFYIFLFAVGVRLCRTTAELTYLKK